MTGPKPLSNILEITPYKGGQKLDHGWKLSSNENPLGSSPAAQAALADMAKQLEIYPDGSAFELRNAIGQKYGIDPDRLVCGAGSDEIFQLLGRAYLQPGDEIIQSAHGFLVYRLVAQQSGAACITAGMELAGEEANVLVTRTFSKIHGLAGLRLGWAYGPESVIDAIHRVRGPFNVTSVAQVAGIAALSDDGFVSRSVEHNNSELDRIKPALEGMGYKVYPSVGNFLLIQFEDRDGKRADDADAFLRQRGIVIRDMKAYGLPDCMRLSIGTKEANDDVLDAFEAFAKAD